MLGMHPPFLQGVLVVAKIWKSYNLAWHDMPDITDNGWLENGEIDWVENYSEMILRIF